ncbi:hypothetical protein POUND7_020633 [Theobroma cacao]
MFFLLSCSLTLVLSFSPSQTLQSQCLDDQRSALLQLQQGLYYSHYFTLSSKAELWDVNTDCCSWKGVTCDALGHVIGLVLSYKNLSGNFQSIFNLHHLQWLNLAENNFNATLFPSRFDKLPNLTHLNLSHSCFHGQIPMGISYLTRLVSLDLSNQDSCYWRNTRSVGLLYNVYFPTLKLEKPNFKILIKNMKSLTELYLDGVNISTQSTKWCETMLPALPKLRVLSMSHCGLTGSLCSSLSQLHSLSKLKLDHNPISYLPPNFLEIASLLVSLSLSGCNLSGHFPTKVFLLPKVQSIDISMNPNLNGQLPEFPLNSTLQVLSLQMTNFSGKLPESLGNLELLTNLNLGECNFFGQIPSAVANLTNLVELVLGANNFSGLLPPFHRTGVPNLSYLNLGGNWFSGAVHSSIFTLPSLKILYLDDNQLVGEIDEFPNASFSLMQELYLGNNYLRGSIPKSILQLPRLECLFLDYNNFGSMKLDMFSQLKNLRYLGLSNMSLSTKSDDKSLTLPQLGQLQLRSCNLTEFPEFIKTQDELFYLDLSNNQIHGFVPNWLWKSTLQEVKMIFDDLRLMKASLDGVIMNKLVLFPLRKLFILLLLPRNAFYALDVLSRFGCSLNAIIAFLSCARPIGTLWGHNRSRVLYE